MRPRSASCRPTVPPTSSPSSAATRRAARRSGETAQARGRRSRRGRRNPAIESTRGTPRRLARARRRDDQEARRARLEPIGDLGQSSGSIGSGGKAGAAHLSSAEPCVGAARIVSTSGACRRGSSSRTVGSAVGRPITPRRRRISRRSSARGRSGVLCPRCADWLSLSSRWSRRSLVAAPRPPRRPAARSRSMRRRPRRPAGVCGTDRKRERVPDRAFDADLRDVHLGGAPGSSRDRGYCFTTCAYYDGAAAALAGICKELQGRFAAGGACASERHVGTCFRCRTAPSDGRARCAGDARGRAQASATRCRGGRFFALGEPVAHAAASSFACDDPPRGVCRETRVASPAALAEARRQCVGLGTGRDGPCPDKNRVAICQSLVPFLRDHYYAPKFDAGSARKDCAGTIVP